MTGDREAELLPGSFGVGRLGGVPVRVHWSVVIIMALIAWGLAGQVFPAAYPGRSVGAYAACGIAAAAVFLLGLLAHEAAHAIVARHHGVAVDSITLWMLGGVARLGGEAGEPGAELRIAAAGPLTSLLLGAVFFALGAALGAVGVTGLPAGALAWLAWINVLLAVFNLLPGAPLDGGRLLRAALWKWRGNRTWASATASRTGQVLGAVLLGLGLAETLFLGAVTGLWLALIGWFVLGAATAELRSARVHIALDGVRVRDVMTPFPDTAPPDMTVREFVDRHLFEHRHATFPLVEHGRPVGLVTLSRVKTVPVADRERTPLRAVACPMAEVPVAASDEPLTALLPRLSRGADGRALVLDDGRLVGIVSPVDITRAVERSRLAAHRP